MSLAVRRSTLDVFHMFEGMWKLTREITHYGTMTGEARFTAAPSSIETYIYREEGSCFRGNFYQEYQYRYVDGEISVLFSGGGLLHTLCFNEEFSQATAIHRCAQDVYHATYDFFNSSTFVLTYFITGPQKNFSIQTTFTKVR